MSDPAGKERVLGDEERARALLEQLKGVHAVDVARDMALGLINFCSPKLGLTDDTRAVRDLGDVRLSIELLRAVVGVLDAEGGHPTHDLHDALAQLQLAYAHAVQLANAERAGGEEPPTPEAGRTEEPDRKEEPAPEEASAKKEAAARKQAAAPKQAAAGKKAASSEKPAAGKKPASPKKQSQKKKPAAGD